MEHHPLLKELLQVCATHNVEPAKAYTTFEVYQELSEVVCAFSVRKLSNLTYFFSTKLNLFYLSGKAEPADEAPGIYIPVKHSDEISPQEMDIMQEILSPEHKQVYLFIRDQDSSSTCYCITKGLVRPDSPETCKKKKEFEAKKHQFERNIQNNRKILYTKALRQKKLKKMADEEQNAS